MEYPHGSGGIHDRLHTDRVSDVNTLGPTRDVAPRCNQLAPMQSQYSALVLISNENANESANDGDDAQEGWPARTVGVA